MLGAFFIALFFQSLVYLFDGDSPDSSKNDIFMNCQNCSHSLPAHTKFCPKCGCSNVVPKNQQLVAENKSGSVENEAAPRTKNCPTCAAHALMTAKFCTQCGHVFCRGQTDPQVQVLETQEHAVAAASTSLCDSGQGESVGLGAPTQEQQINVLPDSESQLQEPVPEGLGQAAPLDALTLNTDEPVNLHRDAQLADVATHANGESLTEPVKREDAWVTAADALPHARPLWQKLLLAFGALLVVLAAATWYVMKESAPSVLKNTSEIPVEQTEMTQKGESEAPQQAGHTVDQEGVTADPLAQKEKIPQIAPENEAAQPVSATETVPQTSKNSEMKPEVSGAKKPAPNNAGASSSRAIIY